MKSIIAIAFFFYSALFSLSSFAQKQLIPINEPNYNKPKMFHHMTDTISINPEVFVDLLQRPVGNFININLSANSIFQYHGQVISFTGKFNDSIQVMVIQSANFEGAVFTLSRIIKYSGVISYTGRIMSFRHIDLYELQNKNGNYSLVKRNFYDLVNE